MKEIDVKNAVRKRTEFSYGALACFDMFSPLEGWMHPQIKIFILIEENPATIKKVTNQHSSGEVDHSYEIHFKNDYNHFLLLDFDKSKSTDNGKSVVLERTEIYRVHTGLNYGGYCFTRPELVEDVTASVEEKMENQSQGNQSLSIPLLYLEQISEEELKKAVRYIADNEKARMEKGKSEKMIVRLGETDLGAVVGLLLKETALASQLGTKVVTKVVYRNRFGDYLQYLKELVLAKPLN